MSSLEPTPFQLEPTVDLDDAPLCEVIRARDALQEQRLFVAWFDQREAAEPTEVGREHPPATIAIAELRLWVERLRRSAMAAGEAR